MKINVSVVIPVYNEEKILEMSIREFVKYLTANRKIGKFEIIIAENGSTDDTYKIAQKIAGLVIHTSGSGETFFGAAKPPYMNFVSNTSSSLSESLSPKQNKQSNLTKRQTFKAPQKAYPSPEILAVCSRHPLKYESKWNFGNTKVKLIKIGEKSLGKALTLGIKKASYEFVYFDAIDNPFDFMDLEKFLEKISSNDLIFASKNHPQSVYKSKIARIIASKILSTLNRLLFALPITDTQGTFMGKREKLIKILPFCTARGAFFQIQLAIYAIRGKLKVTEVPVEFVSSGKKSNFSLVKDGLVLLGDLIWERAKLFCK